MSTPPHESNGPTKQDANHPEPAQPAPGTQEAAPGPARPPLGETVDHVQSSDAADGPTPSAAVTLPWRGPAGSDAPRQAPDSLAIPGYEILEELGRGGMGIVYRARQVKADRVVALKLMLHAEHAGSTARARFDTEAQAVARLQHANIVQVFEVGEVGGAPFFSLEFVAGGTLADRVKKTLLPTKEVVRLTAALARTMAYAHRSNIVHRDLKPGNVLLTPEGEPKIADFGLARKTEVDVRVTQAGAVVGTPSYMAPEQARGDPDRVGPAADVYALGAILYELLTGRPPFLGSSLLAVLEQVRSAEPAPPGALQPYVPRDLETICLKCLRKEAAQRYGSADDLADDLERYQRGEPIVARPIGRLMRVVRWCRRNPAPTALIAVCLLAAGAASGLASAIAAQKDEIARQNQDLAARQAEITQKNEQLAVRQEEIEGQNKKLAANNEEITKQSKVLADKERLATARLDYSRVLVTTFAAEVPAIADYHPLGDEMKEDLTELTVRLLRGAEGKDTVGTLTERGLLILATRQGDLARIQKKLDLAERRYQEAMEIAERVVRTETVEKDKATSNLSFAWIKMGELATDRNKFAEAIRHYRKALALRQQLVDAPQSGEIDPVDCRLDLGRIHHILGQAYFVAGDSAAALAEAQRAVELLEQNVSAVRDPKRAELGRRDLANASITAGNLAFRADQPELGRRVFDRALDLCRRDVAANPRSLAARYALDKVACEYGDWCIMKLNQPEEALRYYQLAQVQNRALCDSNDVVNVTQMGLALGYYRLGLAAQKAGRADEAKKYYGRCADLREIRLREVEEESRGLSSSRKVVDARIDLMLAQARCGRSAEVIRLTDELLKSADRLKPVNPNNPGLVAQTNETKAHYQIFVGEGLSVLAETLSPSDPRRAELTARAIDAVRLAVDNGFSNLWYLENDPDFDAIRPDPAYQAILKKLRTK
jgi:tetratricopeptide (TPR) repeat protein/tRNA A-37 threonylcarbamoyl transferase component Bud32